MKTLHASVKPASSFSLAIWSMIFGLIALVAFLFAQDYSDVIGVLVFIVISQVLYIGSQLMKKLEQIETKLE